MAYQGSGDYRRGFDRDEEFRSGSGGRGQYGREAFGEESGSSGRGEYDEAGQRGGSIYGQGRRNEEPWRPGQSRDYSEGGSQGYGSQGSSPQMYGSSQRYGPEYGRGSYGFGTSEPRGSQGYGSEGYGSQGSERFGSQGSGSQEYGSYGSSEGFGGGQQGYAGSYGYGRESQRYGSMGSMGSTKGRHTGKGPKGFTRSDDRIKEDVSEKLEQHGEIDASEIEVKVSKGEVTLEGSVEDRRTKRMAEDIVEECSGVKDVTNRLKVKKREGAERGSYGAISYGSSSGASSRFDTTTQRDKGGATSKSSSKS